MRRYLVCVIIGIALVASGCTEDRISAPPAADGHHGPGFSPEAAAWVFVQHAGWPVEIPEDELGTAGLHQGQGPPTPMHTFQRTPVTGDIFHYSMIFPVGPGEYDAIRVHRVVRERRPFVPIRTHKAVFMQHGASKDFIGMFLPGQYSSHMADDFGCAVYLAQNDVDVWGIDQAWNLVPPQPEGCNYPFMADWGMQRQIDDLAIGIAIARWSRVITGYGLRPMILMGYSMGAQIGYGLLNAETQLPRGLRQVKGFIPVDFSSQTDSEELIALFDYSRDYWLSRYSAGVYGESGGFREVGQFAVDDPDGDSVFIPGLTNLQAAMFFGAGQVWGPDLNVHYLAGVGEGFLWDDFQFVEVEQWLDFARSAPAAEPMLLGINQADQLCGYTDQWHKHLALIKVPVFYVGANGGLGTYSTYTQTLIGSSDITELIISTNPPDGILYDFGHIDMFIGYNAPWLVWQPILEWIQTHSD